MSSKDIAKLSLAACNPAEDEPSFILYFIHAPSPPYLSVDSKLQLSKMTIFGADFMNLPNCSLGAKNLQYLMIILAENLAKMVILEVNFLSSAKS